MSEGEYIPAEREHDPLAQRVAELVEREFLNNSYAMSTHIEALQIKIDKQNVVLRKLFERIKALEGEKK